MKPKYNAKSVFPVKVLLFKPYRGKIYSNFGAS